MLKEEAVKTGKLVAFNGSDQPLELKEYALQSLQPGEILVKNRYTTLCGSDIHTFCGMRKEVCPTVLGHEIVGEIADFGSGHSRKDYNGEFLSPGQLITWSLFSSDPQSLLSKEGIPQKGNDLFKYGHALVTETDAFHGGLSEYCVLRPDTGVFKVPNQLPLPIAATLNCAAATVAGALRMAGDIKGKNVVISGMGLLGIYCIAMCKNAGANWIGVTDLWDKRLQEGQRFGADEVIRIDSGENGVKSLQDLKTRFEKKGVDLFFDMSGAPDAMEMGLDILGVGGTAIWVGAVFNERKLKIDAEKIVRNLHTIKGLHNYNFDDFKYALHFIEQNWEKYPFTTIVEKEFDLVHAQQAFEYAVSHKPLRVGVRI